MKIGFIDKYLDEWHANHLPSWLREETEIEAIYAYEMMPKEGGISGADWAKEHHAILCDSIEEVVHKSDCLMVLAPSYPEIHEELCALPLKSRKPTYVDKTFAPDPESARRIIDMAKKGGTPMFSSSALRFSKGLSDVGRENIVNISMRGPGPLDMYSIHQIEPIVSLMGCEAESVMFIGSFEHPGYIIKFSGNRFASAMHFDWSCPFNMAIKYSDEKGTVCLDELVDYFPGFVHTLVDFFKKRQIPFDYKETVSVIAIREAILRAKDTPMEWVKVEK